jgi:arylsulfatase A-like enzyme
MSPSARRLAPSLLAGLLGLLVLTSCGGGAEPTRPDVLLITVDTLRADFVHSYGFAAETTPNMDALARRGVLFETAVAASTATVPAHASIMTSRWVREHSVGAWNGASRLEGVATLAEAFRLAGYDTAAFVSNVVLKARTGLDHGFDHYDDELPEGETNRGMYFERVAAQTVDRVRVWLEGDRTRPFFLWVHLQDPHGPYTPGEPWSEVVDEVALRTDRELPVLRVNRGRGGIPGYQALPGERRAGRYAGLYAGEIALTDHWIGELVSEVEEAASAGLVLALTADHGESLDEDGFFFQHGHATTPEQALVPLLLVAPGVSPRRVSGVTSHVDIAPTLLELAGLPPLDAPSGISLVPALGGAALPPDRSVWSDIGREVSAYDASGYVLVKRLPQGLRWQRHERVAAPDGEVDWPKGPEVELPSELRAYLSTAAVEVVPAHAMSEADIERLRALGYLPPAS